MTNEFLYMLDMLKYAIHAIPFYGSRCGINWDILFNEAESHRVLPMVYRAAESLPNGSRPSEQVLQSWKNKLITLGIQVLKQEHYLKILVGRFDKAGLRVLLIKGPVLAALYPHRTDRFSIDIDMLVDKTDLQQADEIFKSEGYVYSNDHSSDNEQTYYNGLLSVELHTRLWEENAGERYAQLVALNVGALSHAVKLEVCGINVWTLPPQDTLIYLFYHIIKHFFVCGVGVRYLCDTVLYIQRYQSMIDWRRFWEDIQAIGYTGFARSFLYICKKYLNLSLEQGDLWNFTEKECLNAESILADMFGSGHDGKKSLVRYKTGRILRIYYENENLRFPNTNIEMVKRVFFPTREELTGRKTLNKISAKNIIMAWIQNLLFYASRWKETKGQRCSLRQRIVCAKQRLLLLKDLNLLK